MSDLNTPPFPFGENTCDNEVNTILAAAIKVAAENEMASVSNPNDFIPILPNSPYEDFLMNKVLDWEEQNSRDLTSFASNIMNEYYANSANTHWAQLPAEQSTSFDSSFPSSAFTATAPSFYSSSSSSFSSSSLNPAIFQQNNIYTSDACGAVNSSDNGGGEIITFTVVKKEEEKEEEEEKALTAGEEVAIDELKKEVEEKMECEEVKILGHPIFAPINIADYIGATDDFRNYEFYGVPDLVTDDEDCPLDLSCDKKQMNTIEIDEKPPARNEIGKNYRR